MNIKRETIYRILFIIFLLQLVIFLFSVNNIVEGKNSKIQKENFVSLPSNVLATIKRFCPNCKVVSLENLEDEAREEFLELYPHGKPGWVSGDFDGNDRVDYALLLQWKKKDKIFERLVILLSSKNNEFDIKVLVKDFEGWGFWYIGLAPAKTVLKHTKAFEPEPGVPEEVELLNPGIKFYKAGSTMSVFYFENGEFKVIPVSY